MPSLMTDDQVTQVRQAFTDLADTFAFPIALVRTTQTGGAFSENVASPDIPLTAIRDFKSSQDDGSFRNNLGPQSTGEFDLYIGWQSLEDAGLVTVDDGVDIDNNDLIRMEGEIYEIKAFGGVGDMTTRPVFLKVLIRRRFQSSNGASGV